MIKPDSAYMQSVYSEDEVAVPEARREELAHKGQVLYAKYCGTKGTGICAESFAEYHIWRGEFIIARDLVEYLYSQAESLKALSHPNEAQSTRLHMTEELIERIEALLGDREAVAQA